MEASALPNRIPPYDYIPIKEEQRLRTCEKLLAVRVLAWSDMVLEHLPTDKLRVM